ncbi:MAG: MFS transporter [Chloroflexi bacterium]|nr:MFS transporter [Chloroflexota bacterium]
MNVATLAARVRSSRINYGWASIAVVFASMAVAIGGGQYVFGVFVKPLAEEFGWSRTQINVALSFSAIGGLLAPMVGRAMDRYGARLVVSLSLALMSVSFLLRPFVTELWQFYALSIMQFAGFPGAAMLPGARLVGIWFPSTRGRMMGVTAIGANFGGFTVPILAGFLVASASWQWGYASLGFLAAAIAVASVFFIRETLRGSPGNPRATGGGPQAAPAVGATQGAEAAILGATVREALRSRSFYAVSFGMFAGTFAYQAVLSQIVPHLQNVGLSLGQATLYLSLVAVIGMVGKVIFGYLTERTPVKYVLTLSLLLQCLGVLGLMTLGRTPYLWLVLPVHALSHGGMGAVWPLLVQDSFGLKHFGAVFGLANMATIGSSLIGPLMMGLSFDSTGSYNLGFAAVIGIFLMGSAVLQLARASYREPRPGKAKAIAVPR